MKLIFRLLSIIISVLFAVLGFTDTADGGKIDNQEKGEK